MKIAICGSLKFFKEMKVAESSLKRLGHKVYMPVEVPGIDYWGEDGKKRVDAKRKLGLVSNHFKKIEKSDAILVVNITKKEIKNYIGANTFLEMGYAYYIKRKIFTLNPLPKQEYVSDELLSFDSIVINSDYLKIK